MFTSIFKIDPREKIVVFIDGQSFHRDAKEHGYHVDFTKLFAAIQSEHNYVMEYNYYTQRRDKDPNNTKTFNIQQLLDWLTYNGVRVVSKERDKDDYRNDQDSWPDFICDLTVDAMLAEKSADHFIFVTSNEAYLPLFQHLRNNHKKVTLVATTGNSSTEARRRVPIVLRKAVHNFIDTRELKPIIEHIASEEKQNRAT